MPRIITLKTISSSKGLTTVIEKILPFKIKRVYFIYGFKSVRGYHKHKKTTQALVCINGSCVIHIDGKKKRKFKLNKKNKCLILNPEDWHTINGNDKTVLLVMASHYFDVKDYIYEK